MSTFQSRRYATRANPQGGSAVMISLASLDWAAMTIAAAPCWGKRKRPRATVLAWCGRRVGGELFYVDENDKR